jgi:hypothetical protein
VLILDCTAALEEAQEIVASKKGHGSLLVQVVLDGELQQLVHGHLRSFVPCDRLPGHCRLEQCSQRPERYDEAGAVLNARYSLRPEQVIGQVTSVSNTKTIRMPWKATAGLAIDDVTSMHIRSRKMQHDVEAAV